MPKRLGLVHLGTSAECPRAQRLRQELGGRYSISVVSEDSTGCSIGVRQYGLVGRLVNFGLLVLGLHEAYLARKYRLQGNLPHCDLGIVCHDLLILPLLLSVAPTDRVVFDAREFYPKQFEQDWLWRLTFGRLADYLCRRYLEPLRARITVSAGLAQAYKTSYGLNMTVCHSYATYHQLPVNAVTTPVKLVHHGNASPNRYLENMVLMMDHLPAGFQLDLFLVPKEPAYYQRLVTMIAPRSNVSLQAPISFDDIVPKLNAYDVGLFVPPASTFNLQHSMPNKLFEFLQARLAVVVSPLPSAAEFVESQGIGVVAKSALPKDLGDAVGGLEPTQLQGFKHRSDSLSHSLCAAQAALCVEQLLVGD